MTYFKKITQRLLDAETSIKKTRELVELEIKSLSLEDLTDSAAISNFLNTLSSTSEDYLKFAYTYPVFFLLRVCSLPKPIHTTPSLADYIQLLQRVHQSFQKVSFPPEASPSALISNKSLLASLQQFAEHLKSLTLTATPFFVPIPDVFICFKWVEELVLLVYTSHWETPPSTQAPKLNPSSAPILELWVYSLYLAKCTQGANKPPNLKDVAKDLVKNNHGVFISLVSSSENLFLLPLAKQQADAIFKVFDDSFDHRAGTPILGFRDEDLKKLNPEYMFLYDFVFEALFNNISHECSPGVVDTFLKKCNKFLNKFSHTIQSATTNKQPFSLKQIEGLRSVFAQHGFTESNCITFHNLLSIAHQNNHRRWPHITPLISSLHHIILFGNFFYQCLARCSPCSISYNFIDGLLRRASIEAQQAIYLGILSPFPWTASSALRIFLPLVPEKELTDIALSIPSSFMRSLFEIAAQRDWKLPSLIKQHSSYKSSILTTETVSLQEVKVFCKQLKIGDSQYPQSLTLHPQFAAEFTKSQVIPILTEIFENRVQKNLALMHIRWLITFAVEDSPGLFLIKRSLTLVYFELAHVFSNLETGSVYTLLQYVQDLWSTIEATTPNSPPIPVPFLSYVYRLAFTPLAVQHAEAPQLFVQEVSTLLQKTNMLTHLGFVFCHTPYKYNSQLKLMKMPLANTSKHLSVPIETFKSTIEVLEQSLKSSLTLLAQLYRHLNLAYLDCLSTIEKVQEICKHPIKIDTANPNFNLIKDSYLQCIKRYHAIVSQSSQSCCFNLTSHFEFLFQPDMLPIETAQQILAFSESTDNPEVFLQSIEQPLDADPPAVLPTTGISFTLEDLAALKELVESFPTPSNPAVKNHSIKLYYTDTYDVARPQIDWEKHSSGVFVPKEDQADRFTHITIKQLEQLIVDVNH
ncbi:tegument protein U30 [Harp seal herpesvirus]|uniref:Tegument protein U30 n=1 Tax=phocid gammaherpesvirus 3 TaxID=2560643 RepID=A0A0R5Z2W3_9GAMA|nr:tegument protein U30 [Harp seal herpesvirus]AJG42990.1 tegument protein U30 [Harp seal herpesvirus]